MIEEALEHYQNGNFAAAEALYRKMLDDEPDNPEVLFMLSLVRQSQNDLEEPVDLLNHALRVQPQNPSLHYSLGTLQLQRRQLDEAEQAFHQAVGIDPNFVEAQNGVAIVELARGRFAAAEHALRKALKSDPENEQAIVNMGVALLEQGKTDDATRRFQQALELNPDSMPAQIHLGRAFLASDNSGFAIQCFENALEQSPDSAEILQLLALAFEQSGQLRKTAEVYRRLLFLGEESPEIVYGLARAEYALENLKEAEGLFLRSLRLDPGREEILLDFARLLLDRGRNREVISRLQPRLEQAEDVSRLRRLLAEARLESGDTQGAMEVLRPMLSEGAPSDSMRLMLARTLMATGEADAANSQIDRLLDLPSPPVDAILLRARQFLARKEVDEAIDLLRSVQRNHQLESRQRLKAVALLADTLHKSGNYQAAWEQLIGLEQRESEPMAIRKEKPLQMVENEAAETAMAREVAWSWPPQPPEDKRPEPIFVFAWPGAGREPLLLSLGGHAAIVSVHDELAAQTERRLVFSHPQGEGPLNDLTVAEIQLARRKYWKSLRKADPMAGRFNTVDGAWLTVESLPTIYRLFPQAQVVVLQQDPRDMVVYWLQSGYADIEKMAATYARQLELLQRCREGVPLNYIDIDTQALLADPGGVLRNLISSLSLAWDDAVEEKFRASGERDFAEQGVWRHYNDWLLPAMEAVGRSA
jgi:tetratricopeptide (TPR) repeat protein